jgi:hypothetical protein
MTHGEFMSIRPYLRGAKVALVPFEIPENDERRYHDRIRSTDDLNKRFAWIDGKTKFIGIFVDLEQVGILTQD